VEELLKSVYVMFAKVVTRGGSVLGLEGYVPPHPQIHLLLPRFKS